jgi:hypothetical protein
VDPRHLRAGRDTPSDLDKLIKLRASVGLRSLQCPLQWVEAAPWRWMSQADLQQPGEWQRRSETSRAKNPATVRGDQDRIPKRDLA